MDGKFIVSNSYLYTYILQVFSGVSKVFTDQQMLAMKHGVDNEVNAIATLCAVILPCLEPDLVYYEEGVHVRDGIAVSSDGSLRSANNDVHYAVEIKCPTGVHELFTLPVHYKVPKRYIIQCLFEAMHTDAKHGTLYLSYCSSTTTVFIVPRNPEIEELTMDICKDIYEADVPKRPSKATPKITTLQQLVCGHVEKCTFLGEYPSRVADTHRRNPESDVCSTPWLQPQRVAQCLDFSLSTDNIVEMFELARDVLEKTYQMMRTKASQVVVFLLADMDRTWSAETGHTVAIGYFLRGYSLTVNTMRRVREQFRQACHERGLNVPMSCSDGEWHQMMTISDDGCPLTAYQLSRTVWKDCSALDKKQLIAIASTMNKSDSYEMFRVVFGTSGNSEPIIVQRKIQTPPPLVTPQHCWKSHSSHKKEDVQSPNNQVPDEDIVAALNSLDDDIDDDIITFIENEPDIMLSAIDQDTMNNDIVDVIDPHTPQDVFDVFEEMDDIGPNLPQKATPKYVCTADDITSIKVVLNKHDKKKWSGIDCDFIKQGLSSASQIRDTFRRSDIVEIIRYMNIKFRKTLGAILLGQNKTLLVNQLCERIADGSVVEGVQRKNNNPKKNGMPASLYLLAINALKKQTFPVHVLRVAIAVSKYDQYRHEWVQTSSHIPEEVSVHLDVDSWISFQPYYRPAFNEKRQQIELGMYFHILS